MHFLACLYDYCNYCNSVIYLLSMLHVFQRKNIQNERKFNMTSFVKMPQIRSLCITIKKRCFKSRDVIIKVVT